MIVVEWVVTYPNKPIFGYITRNQPKYGGIKASKKAVFNLPLILNSDFGYFLAVPLLLIDAWVTQMRRDYLSLNLLVESWWMCCDFWAHICNQIENLMLQLCEKSIEICKKGYFWRRTKKTWITKFASIGEIDNLVCLDSNPPTVNAMHFIFKNGFRTM